MTIWKSKATPAMFNELHPDTIIEHLGIEITEIGDDYIRGTMPVDHRTHQPMKILHGGASVVLAETLGSFATHMAGEPGCKCVGLEVNANHIRTVHSGFVTGTAKPIHIGKSTQVWSITVCDEEDRIVCVSRLTMAILRD
ncbi:MAG: hotdog fold thioesterase [Deltaproteobacteria bacterium]|nr:hotdog fold thioesterase [Deltaproteobacteria bacterium]